ncbi:MAG TPA: methyltransferase domain-containing protein [Mycobacteriales bacterium]|nr:methyltransferase domain-containing protein [Mycobacteriales bacterium]
MDAEGSNISADDGDSSGDAHRYDIEVDPESQGSQGKLARLVGRGKKVLDLGCATGGLAQLLTSWDCTVVGIEADPEAAKLAERWCQRVVVADLDTADVFQLVDGEQFDVVVAGDVLEHLRDPARLLRDLRGVIAPGGYLATSVPNVAHASVRLALLHGDFPYADKGLLDRSHRQFLTRASLLRLLDDGGWVAVHLDTVRVGIEDTEVPFPDDELTRKVLEQVESDPDANVYQYVALAFPASESGLDAVPALARALGDELEQTREHARRLEHRRDDLELQLAARDRELDALRAEAARLPQTVAEQVAAAVAPVRMELLAARDQVAHRDEELLLAANRYNDKTAILRESEAERAILRRRLTEVEDELADIHRSRLWKVATRYRSLMARARGGQ